MAVLLAILCVVTIGTVVDYLLDVNVNIGVVVPTANVQSKSATSV